MPRAVQFSWSCHLQIICYLFPHHSLASPIVCHSCLVEFKFLFFLHFSSNRNDGNSCNSKQSSCIFLSHRTMLWGSEANFTDNERELRIREPKLRRMQTKRTKNSLSIVNFSKSQPLYKCRSASFYRETNGLFTYRIALV